MALYVFLYNLPILVTFEACSSFFAFVNLPYRKNKKNKVVISKMFRADFWFTPLFYELECLLLLQ